MSYGNELEKHHNEFSLFVMTLISVLDVVRFGIDSSLQNRVF